MKDYSEPSAFSKYLTVSKKDKDWQIYCTCVGTSVIPPGADYPVRPKQHPDKYVRNWIEDPGNGRILQEFQILYITQGKGTFCTNKGEIYRITEGTAFLLFPGIPHWYCPDIDQGWNEYWVGFKGSYPRTLLKAGFFTPASPVFQLGVYETVVEDFLKLIDIAQKEPPGFQQQCGALVINLLAKIISYSQARGQGGRIEELIEKARILFEENIYTSLDMSEILQSLEIDYAKFRKIFKNYTGLSPYQYFLQMKINKAKSLLQEGQLSIKEIAFNLAFENQYYFSRIFKSKTGLSPTEWQREHAL